MRKKFFLVVMSACLAMAPVCNVTTVSALAGAVEMDGFYAGGIVTTTGTELEHSYGGTAFFDNSWDETWNVNVTVANGMTLSSVVVCKYIDGLLDNYDACKLIGSPEGSSCCYAYVKNGNNDRKDTEVMGGNFASNEVKVKHVGNDATFGCVFGRRKY